MEGGICLKQRYDDPGLGNPAFFGRQFLARPGETDPTSFSKQCKIPGTNLLDELTIITNSFYVCGVRLRERPWARLAKREQRVSGTARFEYTQDMCLAGSVC